MAYEYRFDPSQEFKGAQKQFYLLDVETEDGNTAKVTFVNVSCTRRWLKRLTLSSFAAGQAI
jgi:hypothetical protein